MVSAAFCFITSVWSVLSNGMNHFFESRSIWDLFLHFHINLNVAVVVLLFLAGVLILAGGFSRLFKTFDERAQKHVDAGAEFTKISRLALLRRHELQVTQPGNLHTRCCQTKLYKVQLIVT